MKRLNTISSGRALEILNKVHFFDVFNSAEKEVLTGFHSHFFLYKKADIIIKQGASDQSFFILLNGKISILRKDSKKSLATLTPGDIFGEVSFLTERLRTTSVIAIEDCIVFEIDKATLNHLDISIREKLKDNIINILVTRLNILNAVVVKLSAP